MRAIIYRYDAHDLAVERNQKHRPTSDASITHPSVQVKNEINARELTSEQYLYTCVMFLYHGVAVVDVRLGRRCPVVALG